MDDEEPPEAEDAHDTGVPRGQAPWDLDAEPVAGTLMPIAPPPAEGVAWAELPLRAGALLIDLAIVSVVTDLIGRAINWIWTINVYPSVTDPYVREDVASGIWQAAMLLVPTALMWVLIGAAAVYVWTVYRATPGQMALGLFTVDAEGRALRRRPAAVRFVMLAVGWILTGATDVLLQIVQLLDVESTEAWRDPLLAAFAVLPLAWFAVLTITIVRDPRGQGWHDKVAGSVVVRRSGPPS